MTTVITPGNSVVEILTVEPDAQASTNDLAVVDDSAIDARPWRSVAFTIVGATEDVDWSVYGANDAAFADEVVVATDTVGDAETASYAIAQAPFAFYRVQIVSTVNDTHGAVTVRGIAKR